MALMDERITGDGMPAFRPGLVYFYTRIWKLALLRRRNLACGSDHLDFGIW
jgi:hypothetical protein